MSGDMINWGPEPNGYTSGGPLESINASLSLLLMAALLWCSATLEAEAGTLDLSEIECPSNTICAVAVSREPETLSALDNGLGLAAALTAAAAIVPPVLFVRRVRRSREELS